MAQFSLISVHKGGLKQHNYISQEMEKIVSRKMKIGAKETMKIAEKLYTQGFISYPRTETNIFPKDLNLVNMVQQQANDPQWGGKLVMYKKTESQNYLQCGGKSVIYYLLLTR